MVTEKISSLLSEYFNLAFAEGKEGRNHDTEAGDAQRVLSELESAISEASERAMLHSADAKTAWAECEVLRARVAELEAALSTDAEPVKPYGYVVELRTTRVQHQNAIARSRVQPYLQVANACVEHWKTIYAEDHWLFEIVPLFAAPPAPSVSVKAIAPVDVYKALSKFVEAGTFDKDHVTAISRVVAAALSAQVQDVAGWQSMDSAPKDGKHCLLAVRSSCFVYAVQGAFMMGKWENSAGIKSEPLCWMPLIRIPQVFLPWTDEFAAAAPAAKLEEKP